MKKNNGMITIMVPHGRDLLRTRTPSSASPNEIAALQELFKPYHDRDCPIDYSAIHRLEKAAEEEFLIEEEQRLGQEQEETAGLDWAEAEPGEEPAHCLPVHLCKPKGVSITPQRRFA